MAAKRFSFLHGLSVALAIGWSDFALKYRGSVLGYFWSFAGPLMKFLVILYVFGPYVRPSIQQYPLYLFLGIILWEYFIATTTGCMAMLQVKSSIIRRLAFPHMILIYAVGWTNLIIFSTHALIFLALAAWFHLPLSAATAYMLLIVFQMTCIALGIGMLIAAYSLKYRDIAHLWGIVLQVLFWLTPIMYPYRLTQPISMSFADLFRLDHRHSMKDVLELMIQGQPLSIIIHDSRRVLLYPLSAGVPSLSHALSVTVVCLLIFFFGRRVFLRRSASFNQEY